MFTKRKVDGSEYFYPSIDERVVLFIVSLFLSQPPVRNATNTTAPQFLPSDVDSCVEENRNRQLPIIVMT